MSAKDTAYEYHLSKLTPDPASYTLQMCALITLNTNITITCKLWTKFRWGTSLSSGCAFCNLFR